VKVIKKADGTVVRKVMSKEEVAKMEKVKALKEKHGVKDAFKPPGVKGK